ncbi:TPA_asm: hypothetical protein HUJ06_000069 [Nelumbo nucifera]|uniref:Uncharacterized protein n=2 Tax=Nelumbo nucifera TaxID=4432 RepID=A0A823A488_NELNU|nr:TPA_asm: hypothetical protein HUJ06_000069 [Nelumbo nucifera]
MAKAASEEKELSKAIVRRVVKDKLARSFDQDEINVHKDALLDLSESARIFVHYLSATEDITRAIIYALIDRSDSELGEPLTLFLYRPWLPLPLEAGKFEATTMVSMMFNVGIKKYFDMTLLSCAYARTRERTQGLEAFRLLGQHLDMGLASYTFGSRNTGLEGEVSQFSPAE